MFSLIAKAATGVLSVAATAFTMGFTLTMFAVLAVAFILVFTLASWSF